MRVLLAEEYAQRERLSLLFLRDALERRGHAVRLSDSYRLEADFKEFRPDLVADNISDTVAHYLGKLAMLTRAHRNVNLIWEELANPFNLIRYRLDDALATGLVDGRATWGSALRDILLVENPAMEPGRVRATGSMKHTVNGYLAGVDRRALWPLYPFAFERYERVVLVTESFELGLLDYDAFRRGQPKGWKARVFPYMYEICHRCAQMRFGFVRLLRRLAAAYPEFLFVLRVHPGKDASYRETYRREFESPNIVFNAEGDIAPLLRLADLLITSRSGVGVDAHVMGIPTVNLMPVNDVLTETGVFDTVEQQFGRATPLDQIDASNFLGFFQPDPQSPRQRALCDRWLGPLGPQSFERVADFMEDIAEMPAVAKSAPLSAYRNPTAVKRHLRNVVRRRGRVGRSPTEIFDYEAVYRLLLAGRSEAAGVGATVREAQGVPNAV